MVNLKSSRSENSFEYLQRNNVKTFRSNHLKNYFETVSRLILAALWTISILLTTSVLLWTITTINFNRTFGNLGAMNDFNFTNIQLMLLLQSGCKPLLLEESLADKFHLYLPQLAYEFQFFLISAEKRLWKIFFTKRVGHCSFLRVV